MADPVDDWAPVGQPQPQDDWKPVGASFDEHFSGQPEPQDVPPSFLHRLAVGMMIGENGQSPADLRAKGFEDFDLAKNTADQFKAGLDRIKKGFQETHSAYDVGAGAFQSLMSPAAAAFQAIGGAGEKASFGLLTGDQINTALMVADGAPGRFSRVRGGTEEVIGSLPQPRDFSAAAKTLGEQEQAPPNTIRLYRGERDWGPYPNERYRPRAQFWTTDPARAGDYGQVRYIDVPPDELAKEFFRDFKGDYQTGDADFKYHGLAKPLPPIERNLRQAWEQDGIHPAEAVHDAQRDAFVKHDLTAADREPTELPKADEELLTETGGRPAPLSAAATLPEDVPLSQQPASPPGRLAAAAHNAADRLYDIGRDAQMLVSPMATGTRDSMAIAKDFANATRRNRWEWSRIDDDIAARFDPEQRRRMWNAADEESVSRQLGEPQSFREHQGLATLEPEERAAVEDLQARAQSAWLRARDLGMVEGEGLPAYAPRMVINAVGAGTKEKAIPLNGLGTNLRTRTGNMLQRKYLEAQETEAAAKAKYGDQAALARDIRVLPLATSQLEDAIAGRTLINNIKNIGKQTGAETVAEGGIPAKSDFKWFTIDHPAFRTWRPKFEEIDGKVQALKDSEGNMVFEQVPIYVRGDFEGPLRAVLNTRNGALYNAAMSLKGKTMGLIMNSPMIHNAVEWGRALPAMPGKVATFKVYFEGNRAKNDPAIMREAIDNGLVPIGKRFFNQDISSIMEEPNLTPGRSWTSQVLGFVPGLFDEGAGNAVKAAIDKAGDFWHNTLLWDRVADLQMGLYVNMRADAIAKGLDAQTASRVAAHWANRYAGALPKEAMSSGATKIANMLLFSRSFTMGNLGVMKDMLTGLPKDVIAQIERDAGFGQGSIAAADETSAAVSYAKSMARRKAMAVVALDMGLMYVGNSILQSAMNVMLNDSSLEKELHGYAQRFTDKLQAVREHPLELVQPLHLLEDLSSTSENEPGRKDRVHVGNMKDGTAIYARNPVGKLGEEFQGWMTGPLDMMRKKLGTIARPVWQIMNNDAGFGRKIYDPQADTPAKYLKNLGLIAAHIAGSQLPEGQLNAFSDLIKGEGDAKINALQAFGPVAGVTFSKGAPGGPAVGELYAARQQHDLAVQMAMPDIRRQIQRGDIAGATQRMTELGIPGGLQRFYLRTTQNPATRLSPRTLRDFYLYASPEQRARMERILH